MFVSRKLREENIAEYLLYMWQVEDMLRSCSFDADALKAMVDRSGCQPEQKSEWLRWYDDLIDMMTREEVREKGHIQINNNILILLEDLHSRLLASACTEAEEYKAAYYRALPAIVGFRAKSEGQSKGELENCFDFMYGIWMLKLQKREISEGTAKAAADVSTLLGLLSALYKKDLDGSLDLDGDKRKL